MKLPVFLTQTPIAHRGLHDATHPENSLAAFENAIQHGYAVETDVRFSKDNQLVVFHDAFLARMTGQEGAVAEYTAAELAELRLAGGEQRIPLFQDALACLSGREPLLLEIKDMPGVPADTVARAVREAMRSFSGEYAVQSFQPSYVRAYKKLCPEIACGILGSGETMKKTDFGGSPVWRIKAFAVRKMSIRWAEKLDFLSYRAEDYPSPALTAFPKTKLAWTVRSQEEADRLKPYVDNIIFENFLA